MTSSKFSPQVIEVQTYLKAHHADVSASELIYKEVFEEVYQDYLNGKKNAEFLSILADQILYANMIYKNRNFEDLRFQDLLETGSELSYKLSREQEKVGTYNHYLELAHDVMVKHKLV